MLVSFCRAKIESIALAYRQTSPLVSRFSRLWGTVDQIVDSRLASKVTVLASLMTDASLPTMALPDEDDYGPAVDSDADIEELLRHLSGE